MATTKPWWQSDKYDIDDAVPPEFEKYLGPQGLALVRAWPDGRTDQGWGLNAPVKDPLGGAFMERYIRGEFNPRRVLFGYNKGKHAFAFVMRSVRLVCIDIDGKNGGLEHASRLGALPPTLAETSKSGDGYHLFYEVDEPWDETIGFGLLNDRIGVEQGVDIRAVGCVYHHDTQRWNGRRPAKLPVHLQEQIIARSQKVAATQARIASVVSGDDEMEKLMLQDELVTKLAKPIAPGNRNNTLFAIGSQMAQAGVPDWEQKILDRAGEVGLGADEADKLVANLQKQAPAVTP